MAPDTLNICPYCRNQAIAPVRLNDGRAYCSACVDRVSPELKAMVARGEPLLELVGLEDVSGWRYFRRLSWLGFIAVAILIGLIGFSKAKAGNFDPLFLLTGFGLFYGLFLGINALFAALGAEKWRDDLPRMMTLVGEELVIRRGDEEKRHGLADCRWYEGKTSQDELTLFTGLRRGVVIQTPESHLACGYTDARREAWRAMLTLAHVPTNPPQGCLFLLVIAAIGASVGCGLGWGLGQALSAVLGNNQWMVLAFLGLIDGGAAAAMYATCTSEGAVAARARMHPIVVILGFFAVGFKIGIVTGFPIVLIIAAGNAAVGLVVALICQRKIRAFASLLEENP